MKFNKDLIYKIIDNKNDKLELGYLNDIELNTLYYALNLNYSLKKLDLSPNLLEDITLLCKTLNNNSCLKYLKLSRNKIENNFCLELLDLLSNQIEIKKMF